MLVSQPDFRLNAPDQVAVYHRLQDRILAKLEIGYWHYDPIHRVLQGDDTAARLLGLSVADMARNGLQWDAQIFPADREAARRSLQRCIDAGEAGDYSFRVNNPGEDPRWLRNMIEPMADGTFMGALKNVSARSINTELRSLVREAVSKRDITARLFHKNANAMSTLNAALDGLEHMPLPLKARELLQASVNSAATLSDLFRVLSYAVAFTPNQTDKVDVTGLIEEVAQIGQAIRNEDQRLNVFIKGDLPPGIISGPVIKAALTDAVFNALEILEHGGGIIIAAWPSEETDPHGPVPPGNYIAITVATYPSLADMDKVPQPRLHNMRFDYCEGGFWEQSNETPHDAAQFLIPAARDGKSCQASCDLRSHNTPEVRRVLLVEDDPKLRTFMSSWLGAEGIEVLEAETGDRAYQLLLDGADPDLIVTDIVMPGSMHGSDVISNALHERVLPPVLYHSGYSAQYAAPNIRLRAVDRFLPKPATRQAFMEMIRSFGEGAKPPECSNLLVDGRCSLTSAPDFR